MQQEIGMSIGNISLSIILFQLLTDLAILLNIAYLRQITGFIYLTFIVGFAVMRALRFHEDEFLETVILSVGLSVALVMFVGLFVNELGSSIGLESPLSMPTLLGAMNIIVISSCYRTHSKDMNVAMLNQPGILLFLVPILGVAATSLIGNSQNISLSLLLILVLSGLVVLATIRQKPQTELYPLALFVIAVSLLFHGSLIGSYIVGWDPHSEFHVFKATEATGYWNSRLFSWDDRITNGNAMLSVTVLPTVYSKMTGTDGTLIFKILYPLIFSFLPLVLYKLYLTQVESKASFLSVFLVMSNLMFFAPDAFANKQLVAELYFVLLCFLILKEGMDCPQGNFLFAVFGAALVVSHYSLSYIFLFYISSFWLYGFLTRRQLGTARIALSKVLLFFTLTFSWYVFVSSSSPFDTVLRTGDHIFRTFALDFLDPSARSATVMRGLGATAAISIGHQIGRIFFYITQLLIVLGWVKSVLNQKSTPFKRGYVLFSSVSLAILVMNVVIPNLAASFRMERFYHLSLLVLAPVGIFGGVTLSTPFLGRRSVSRALSLLLLVLIPNFLFETGFIYEITNDVGYYLPLSMHKVKELRRLVFSRQDVNSVQWLSMHSFPDETVYADFISGINLLVSYGMFTGENIRLLLNTTKYLDDKAYIYLSTENVLEGTFAVFHDRSTNTSDILSLANNQNRIYSNGATGIFKGTGRVLQS